jgi:type II secretory pathway pseudopilin PulG
MRTPNTLHRSRRIRLQGGFSLIELLVGFLVLMLVLIGLLPMFTRAVIQNVQGKESTDAANFGGAQLENHTQLSFNNFELDVTAGNFESDILFFSKGYQDKLGDETWAAVPDPGLVTWQRTTEVRQFAITAANDTNLDGVLDEIIGLEDADFDGYFDNALPAGTSPNSIHLKEIRVLTNSARQPLGQGEATQLTLTKLKAF